MSSSEPPSRPRAISHEVKSAQEDIASSRKVEKVRQVDEIDADERTRKKFRAAMGDEESEETTGKPPTPFDLFSTPKTQEGEEGGEPTVFGNPAPSSYEDADDAIVASPAYTPPPDLTTSLPPPDEEEEATTGALPHSEEFWEEVDMPPDQPLRKTKMEETPRSQQRMAKKEAPKGEFSPFGVPGKPVTEKSAPGKEAKKKQSPSLREKVPSSMPTKQPEKEAISTARYFAPEEMTKEGRKVPTAKEKGKEPKLPSEKQPEVVPFRWEEKESGASGEKKQKIVEIEAPSLPLLPASVQPQTFAAVSAANPYLRPSTISLFFQMVGTMYVMATPPGISRTEIVLNNPAYAASRFYGATITLEKYATAPDSFNIRLTGSDAAVTAFRENIPSLMAGFQNSNLPFKVHRVDAEYTIERPVFRRKERGEEKGEAGGGDLGERRK